MDREQASPTAHEQTQFGLLSRTWELELLISGALVFSLMQVPGHLDRYWDRIIFDVGPAGFSLALLTHIYVRAIVVVLIVAFLLNLGARAYWVGLVGLDSVFPHGIRWERSRFGPVTREFYQTRVPGTRRLIELLDNFCSITFSFAFVMVVVFLLGGVFGLGGSIAVFLIARAFGAEEHAPRLIVVTLFGLAFALSAVALIDRWFGERLQGTRSGAVLRRAVHSLSILQVVPLYGSTFLSLVTNLRTRVALPLIYAIMFGVILFVFSDLASENVEITGERFVPANIAAAGVSYDHYESHRPADSRPRGVPSIQSDIVREPYVRLFIPYQARRDTDAVARLCPDATPLVSGVFVINPDREPLPDDGAMRAVLDCIASYREVRLNGEPLRDQPHQFFREPRHGMEGTVVYIPIADLPPGQHLITVNQTPRWRDGAAPDDPPREPRPPYRIPFWR